MGVARDRAEELRGLYQVDGAMNASTLDRLLKHLQSEVFTLSNLPGPLRDLYAEPLLYIRRGQGQPWEKWIKAHVIGHRLLHVGNQLEMPATFIDYQECQAEEFAGWLLWGDPAKLRGGLTVTTRNVAEVAAVPVECVEKWWRIVGGQLAREPYYVLARDWHWAKV